MNIETEAATALHDLLALRETALPVQRIRIALLDRAIALLTRLSGAAPTTKESDHED